MQKNTICFNIHYHTQFGEQIRMQTFVGDKSHKVYSLEYRNANWVLDLKKIEFDSYYYFLYNEHENSLQKEYGKRKVPQFPEGKTIEVFDHWNKFNFPENYLSKSFFLESEVPKLKKLKIKKSSTHLLSITAPISENQQLVILGACKELGNWMPEKAKVLTQTESSFWEIDFKLNKTTDYAVAYKFGIKENDTIYLEEGENRMLPINTSTNKLLVCNESYYRYSTYQMPKKAGVAVPVFSIRTEDGMGIGEFSDIKKMGDWMQKSELSVLQILPINDTIAHHNWNDCYPYAAISVYALNPFYISIKNLELEISLKDKKEIAEISHQLNDLPQIDLDKVMHHKWKWLHTLFNENEKELLKSKKLLSFIKENKDWLQSYAVFCVLRDENKTADFSQWKSLKKYNQKKVESFFDSKHKHHKKVLFYCWVQYELDRQLLDSIRYLHERNIKIKGDLPIGIFRHSVEAWKEPELFGMDFQAGAPPDDFAVLGQNWEFPTYNWELMLENGLQWWKSRFQALEKYFDAMRIDHILGFFRIWRIPKEAVQGIMGYFYPALPITNEELQSRNIGLSHDRLLNPFISTQVLYNQFKEDADAIAFHFLNKIDDYHFQFKEEYNTQRKMLAYLDNHKEFAHYQAQLLYMLSNVLLIAEWSQNGQVFHPRFNLNTTESFLFLSDEDKAKLMDLYNDYFFVRQDGMWLESAMQKLPELIESTSMLICGEDLGLVPASVPKVMDDLAILSLQVQRMTNDDRMYSNPAEAPYLSVVTTGTHDTSTLRQWWEEDRNVSQNYYNNQLQKNGGAPEKMEEHMSQQIIRQHLNAPAMLSIIPLQDWFTLNTELTHPNMEEERINIPAVFPHYWRYRMHISLEDLQSNTAFNNQIKQMVEESGRGN